MTQQQARRRNWQKARLMGITMDHSILTVEEQVSWTLIKDALNEMLEQWDIESEKLAKKPFLPHRCCMCSRRVKDTYFAENEYQERIDYFCLKHYDEYVKQRQIST